MKRLTATARPARDGSAMGQRAAGWLAVGLLLASRGEARADGPLEGARQLVLVTTPSWGAVTGELARFERVGRGAWRAVGGAAAAPVPVVVGRGGLAWGRGLHAPQPRGPQKREGDGCAPAGAFHLDVAFGRAPAVGARLRYVPIVATLECVDDPASSHYNQLVDRATVAAPDWKSAEAMPMYSLGVVVEHNTARPVPGGGSCVFIHGWSGSDGTAGCTGMAEERLAELVRWLDPAAHPVLVQLPAVEAARLRVAWELPVLSGR
jgi:L,D-peptidoglycan transpeptidase YkuD (ErfK/YbiS/YcfS/YnhG family)